MPGRLRRRWPSSAQICGALSPPLHAHKGIVDRARLIEPVVRGAIRRLVTRGPTVGIESQLVMSHRGLVTVCALWLDRRGRPCLSSGWKHRRRARHESNDGQESCYAFHCAQHSMATFDSALAEGGATPPVSSDQNTGSPGATSASRDNSTTSERAFFAPRISTSD
jgi:hypothetical protein